MDDLVIGIDLGTTNSCVSLYTKGRTKILENEIGGRITPSFIYFTPDGEIVIGEHGKNMSVHKPENGIYGNVKIFLLPKYLKTSFQK